MKKGVTNLITAMIVFVLAFSTCITIISADDMLIGRELQIEGVGIVDIDVEVQTEKYYDGLKLSNSLYTPSAGYRGASELRYASILELGMYDNGENETMEMEYIQAAEIVNGKGFFTSKNYLIGSATGYKYTGDVRQDLSAYSDNTLSESVIRGSADGHITFMQKVVDPETRIVIVRDVSNIKGTFNYNYSTYTEHVMYPASELKEYLGCP